MLHVKALAFDTGGTILDWHPGVAPVPRDVSTART